MPTLDDIYQKFGAVAEAAQLLETQLGNMLLLSGGVEQGLFDKPNVELAITLHDGINRRTLDQLIKGMGNTSQPFTSLEALLSEALRERNRLFHHFYREHNFRRNSEDGRAVMWEDLESVHDTLLLAYNAVMLVHGTDLDALESGHFNVPTRHVPI
jgi:hypothetical protein